MRTSRLLLAAIGIVVAIPVASTWIEVPPPFEAVTPLLFLAAATYITWFVFLRVSKEQRARLWHRLFAGFFILYVLGLFAWLAAGLVPAIAHHVPSLHDRMHSYGGAPDLITVRASEIGPFSVEGSRRIREMTMRADVTTYIQFTNTPTEHGVQLPHNVSIRGRDGRAIFVGDVITPPLPLLDEHGEQVDSGEISWTRAFTAPAQGSYEYRCDVHPDRMRGSVRVLPGDAHTTEPLTSQGSRDLVRRMAEVSHQAEDAPEVAVDYLFSAVGLGLGIFLYLLRPRERMARVFGLAMVSTAAAYNLQSHAALAVHASFDDPLHQILHPLTGIMYIYALILFPDGRLVPRWGHRIVRLGYRLAVFAAIMILLGTTGSILPDFGQHPAALVLVFGMIIPFIGVVAQGYRIRRARTSETRQQSRLLAWATVTSFALGIALLLAFGVDLAALIRPDTGDPTVIGAVESRAFRVFQPLFIVIPFALFAGILRYRLWDIDLVINRTLVYGALAGFIGALYVGVVVGLGGAVGGRTGLSIAATLVAAVAFDPLRSRVQRFANRVVYGDRASPYEVMTDVSHRLGSPTSAEDMLPAVAEAAGRALRAERARAVMVLPDGSRREATWPADAGTEAPFDRTVPVTQRGEEVGEISVARRAGDPLRPADNRLLEALASHAGIALEGVRLADELRARLAELQGTTREIAASRRRIVTARDAERSRLERQIHDRVERRLGEMAEALARAERTLPRSRARAMTLLDDVAAEANEVQESLRDLARGIFPPLLADKGLVPALESQARKLGIPLTVVADGLPDRFDGRAEAAVYFCCIEALRPTAGDANGSPITIDVRADDGWINFVVRESGRSAGEVSGSDLHVLADRVEAVGGRLEIRNEPGDGWTISGRVPAQLAAAAAQMPASRSGSKADFGT